MDATMAAHPDVLLMTMTEILLLGASAGIAGFGFRFGNLLPGLLGVASH